MTAGPYNLYSDLNAGSTGPSIEELRAHPEIADTPEFKAFQYIFSVRDELHATGRFATVRDALKALNHPIREALGCPRDDLVTGKVTTVQAAEALRKRNAATKPEGHYPNDERDDWLREQRCKGVSLKVIKNQLKKNSHGWDHIGTDGGITRAIGRYCDRHPEKQRPPALKAGRPNNLTRQSVK
jgi:hypothetical protein